MTTLLNLFQQHKKHIPLFIALLIVTPVLFFQAFRYSFPMGYAGMFTLIAESIADRNFMLPMSVPHYGPGGIPLVYPPLAMYLFAIAIKWGVPIFPYLRFIPAIFTLLALVALYFFTLELTRSEIASALTMLLVITQPPVYYTHVWSAGIVRALALFLCLMGLLFYLRSLRNFSRGNCLLAGLFLGLLLTTHWLYIVLAVLIGLACLLAERNGTGIRTSLSILVLALLVASPWLILILQRHGISNIVVAYSSHGNIDIFRSLGDMSTVVHILYEKLEAISDNWFLAALWIPGLVLLLVQRKYYIPLAFLFVFFMGEAPLYIDILTGMMAGVFCAKIMQSIPMLFQMKNDNTSRLVWSGATFFVLLFFLLSTIRGLQEIYQHHPEIYSQSLTMSSFVRENTSPDDTYLFVGRINEAEWIPFLFDRTPVFGFWGSEWKGTYAEQADILFSLRECELQKNWDCMKAIQEERSVSPDLLVTPNKRWLMLAVKDTKEWNSIYTDDMYTVWKRKD